MGKKPGTLCYLTAGKLLDSQKGFVATFNWLVDFCNNLTGKDAIKVDTSQSDRPVIKLSGEIYYK